MTTTDAHRTVSTTPRPGWPEIVAAAIAFGLGYVALLLLAPLLPDGGIVPGVVLGAASGALGLLAFGGAYVVRIRSLTPFGVRRVRTRWLLIGVAWGVGAFVIVRVLAVVLTTVWPEIAATDPQGSYRDSATGGAVAFALSIVALGIVTPIGEELAFRGVLTNALRRYGALVSVPVSTLVFGLAHGVNLALIPAIVVGAIAAILFLRSDSVWPGVLVHAVNNTLGVTLAAVVGAAA